ncbi:hypothetical protein [Rhodococcus koreensis]
MTDASLPPGHTVALRTGVSAAIAGLPFIVVGAIPGALIGGAIGYASHGIATTSMG